jgi:hypothetical protein
MSSSRLRVSRPGRSSALALAAALGDGSPAPANPAVARSTAIDFRSERTRALNDRLKGVPGGPARRALLDQIAQSLSDDQAARDSGGSASATPALRVNAPKPDLRPFGARGVGVTPPPRQPMDPATVRQALAGLHGAQRHAKLDEMFGMPGGTDSASGEAA